MWSRSLAGIALTGITITWIPFHSDTYPYTISQPSSYRHVVIQDTGGNKVDYFFPTLGSSVTNVNVYSDHSTQSATTFLRSAGGHGVHRSAWLSIMGKHLPLIRADFSGLRERWTIEQVVFTAKGRVWHLTMSYARRFRTQRPVMLHMLKTFRSA